MKSHRGKLESLALPEGSRTITGAFTKEEADKARNEQPAPKLEISDAVLLNDLNK